MPAGEGHHRRPCHGLAPRELSRDDPAAPEELHVCPRCDSELVQPVSWDAVDMARWRVERRCPECEWRTVDVHEQASLDRYDLILDAATHALAEDLEQLQRESMERDCEVLAGALHSGAILPEDF